jgi:hypothetical protein
MPQSSSETGRVGSDPEREAWTLKQVQGDEGASRFTFSAARSSFDFIGNDFDADWLDPDHCREIGIADTPLGD